MMQRVLVVDDECSITTTLSLILRAAGYEVRSANSGELALQIAEDFRPDALITDFAMPKMTGLELAVELNRSLPACRILVFTGQSQIMEPLGVPMPHYHLLFKPVPPEEFFSLLDSSRTKDIENSRRKPRALCVDDVETHRYSLAKFLQHAGFKVSECGTGSEALAKAAMQPDVIVLDIGLPDISGIEVCRRLKQSRETAEIPVLHVTASHLDSTVREASRDAGAYEYISAPFDPDYLLARTRSAVQLRYLQRDDSQRSQGA